MVKQRKELPQISDESIEEVKKIHTEFSSQATDEEEKTFESSMPFNQEITSSLSEKILEFQESPMFKSLPLELQEKTRNVANLVMQAANKCSQLNAELQKGTPQENIITLMNAGQDLIIKAQDGMSSLAKLTRDKLKETVLSDDAKAKYKEGVTFVSKKLVQTMRFFNKQVQKANEYLLKKINESEKKQTKKNEEKSEEKQTKKM